MARAGSAWPQQGREVSRSYDSVFDSRTKVTGRGGRGVGVGVGGGQGGHEGSAEGGKEADAVDETG